MVATSQPTSKYAENTALRMRVAKCAQAPAAIVKLALHSAEKRENSKKSSHTHLESRCTSRHSRWRCKNAGEGACRELPSSCRRGTRGAAFARVSVPCPAQLLPVNQNPGTSCPHRADRGDAGRLSNPPAGGLALLRIASLQLPCGRPELEARPLRALLRGVQISGLAVLSRADFGAALALSVILLQGCWPSGG